MNVSDLQNAVDEAFETTAAGLRTWPDPHPGHSGPRAEEYSRVSDPQKWRILGARAECWMAVLAGRGIARILRHADVAWTEEPGTRVVSADMIVPWRDGALPPVVARSLIEGVADAGVTLGIGSPATVMGWFPHCGCDASDDGSAIEIAALDSSIAAVVTGAYRRLEKSDRLIVVRGDGRATSGVSLDEAERVLDDPRGWEEISGPPWFMPSDA